ncbi:ABC transporter ATP-binding protein [Anabaena cylindrica FACHB-243]|uniref:Sulfate-transporting ATPase n=1 Tax=Anabaena cylindrica (strain ATCC 27899 / PCC 7122) TaxID=272123 RepID=K9ZDS7_ANACC|nr:MULTISPECIES: ABC transporter ATP-binding protein [Anabaena]AFZ57336.1 Sulfate-transporting ATPase [Anabaena cylindrica PCC 7122]MBD2421004.1 ABC transporter ATP-binding protein [Anabaena cylindrica FACHB-243]MBY5280708.1 ABC transporter ATP-binding protein [Anabaena sp. CCAP 1446/1C]MBY5306906.1 ABC transporter ATP-binding protein [Anabaena sp. CCAP 1446/1C]MCM2405757.1 ABC transporter ATP-binding protein [Anabaena sp. CCAP 1446/1C]
MVKEIAISTRGLTKQFERHVAVNDVDLEIQMGEVYGLIGPNGAGKTTLIRMLAAAEEPTTGEIYINGVPLLRDQSNSNLKRHLGYLPDDYPLYEDLTVWDYLDYFARLYRLREPRRTQRLHEVLELIQLGNKRNSIISTLSRGMKQRLSLARTIIHEPILLLLDEPVSGLDPIARMQFREIIKALREAGMTILISSHVLSDLAELCTSVGIMELGFLVESASLQQLYQRLARQQILISTLGNIDALVSELKNYPLVEEWEVIPSKNSVRVNFSGTQEDGAELLRSLISTGIPLTDFHCTQEDLETIFLKLGHKQAS